MSLSPSPSDNLIVVDGITIEKPLDVLKLATPKLQEEGYRLLARKWYESQPSFMKRGKDRFDILISYDDAKDKVLWNNFPLPNSRRLHSNCKRDEHLGKMILVLMVKNES